MLRSVVLSVILSSAIGITTDEHKGRTASALYVDTSGALKTGNVEVFPVPTASRCIVIMVCQYMIIYTALAIGKTYYEFALPPRRHEDPEDHACLVDYKLHGLRSAAQTMAYAPMICVLLIACRMRVEFLSDGKGQPQQWVQACMYALTFAVFLSSLVVLVMPLITGKHVPMEAECDIKGPDVTPRFASDQSSQVAFYALYALRYLILLCLYGGLVGVIVGIHLYLPPGQTDLTKVPPPAPAVGCTMTIAVLFFLIQLVVVMCNTYTDIRGIDFYAGHIQKMIKVCNGAASTVEFGPMLAIVFLAARMRALQHDSQPQDWAQMCMYAATVALCTTTLIAIVVNASDGIQAEPSTLSTVLEALRFVSMMGIYVGVAAVISSIFVFKAPAGMSTAPVSPTVHCVVNLAIQFFAIYGVLYCSLMISELSRVPLKEYKLYKAIEATKSTLTMAPMLAILFVTTRMYALLITDQKGAPPAWVQDGMYMATWSLLISFFICLAQELLNNTASKSEGRADEETPERAPADKEAAEKAAATMPPWLRTTMVCLRYFSMVLLYGGIVSVIVGLFTMTPETANGGGSIPVVSDTVNSTPVGDAPPGPGSMTLVAGLGA